MKEAVRKIGYITQDKNTSAEETRHVPEGALIRFDSGRVVTLDDATHHVLCLGTTGSGKSTNLIFPALLQLLKNGAGGLIIDIKGNLRDKVRALARATGRDCDVIEHGTSSESNAINLLNGINRHGLREFLLQLATQNIHNNTSNLDWHLKGVACAADCGQLLMYLSKVSNEFKLSIRLISEMINSPKDAQKLYEYYRKNVYDSRDLEQRRFTDSIENNRFHVLKKSTNTSYSANTTLEEQLSWGLQGIRDALRNFLEAPGIEAKFCCPGAPALSFAESIMARKIIFVRFELDTGPIGARLARTLLDSYYASIYDLGLKLPKDKKSFVCLDEFQEVADLSNARFSDSSFIALAREFNCIFMAAAQSMSSLATKGEDATAVASFVSNCNQKIIFYNDDPLTQEIVSRHAPDVILSELKSGQAFVATYDAAKREHSHNLESLKKSYELVQSVLANGVPEPPGSQCKSENLPEHKSLFELAEELEMNATAQESERPYTIKDGNKQEKFAREKKAERIEKLPLNDGSRALLEKFPDLFLENHDDVCLNVPNGWLKATEQALAAFRDTGLPLKLAALRICHRYLHAELGKNSSSDVMDALDVLNTFLKITSELCVICGGQTKNADRDEEDYDGDDLYNYVKKTTLRLCGNCRKKYGFASLKIDAE